MQKALSLSVPGSETLHVNIHKLSQSTRSVVIVTNLNMKRAGVGDAPSRIERKRKRQCSESEVHNFGPKKVLILLVLTMEKKLSDDSRIVILFN